MKKFFTIILVAFLAITFTSCEGMKAKRQISRLESLTEKVEKKGDKLSSNEWTKVFEDYEDICNEMSKYEYSNDQMAEIGRLTGRFYTACGSHALKGLGGFLNGAASALGGFLQGVGSSVTDTDVEDLEDEWDESLSELESAIDEGLSELEAMFE